MKWLRKLLWWKRAEPQTYRYHWLDIRSKRRGVLTVQCYSRSEFLATLARYNRRNPNWKYWEAT
jgi:hypothetical protein